MVDFLKTEQNEKFKNELVSTKQLILELICHCLRLHGQRVRYWAIHNDLIAKVVELINSSGSKILQLNVIKFLKTILMNNDDFLTKILINSDTFEEVFKVFNENKIKQNLLFSTIMDLFEYIRRQNIKKIITYLVKI